MDDIIRKVDYFKAQVQDKAGEGARILSALRGEGINLLFFTGFPRGRKAQLDFIPENGPAFRKAARKAGLAVTKKTAFLVQGQDRPGVIAEVTTLAGRLGVNVIDVEIAHSPEGGRGVIVLLVAAVDAEGYERGLNDLGYHVARTDLA